MSKQKRRRQRKNVVPRSAVTMLSVREIAKRYHFHENTVRSWVNADALRCIRYGPGNKIFIAEKAVDKFVKKYYYY